MIEAGARHLSLDVIRGVAVMGILLMNIVGFAMPHHAYSNPHAYGGDGPADIAVWLVNFVLADGKMRGLFSVLFGASMLLVIERAEAAGESAAATHFSRMGWLFVFGAIHAYAIWYGDILMAYAAVGAVAYLFRHREAHRLLILGLSMIFAQAAFWGVNAFDVWALQQAAGSASPDPATLDRWTEYAAAFAPPSPQDIARDLALYRGGYTGILAERLGPAFWLPIRANGYNAVETLGLMLTGMAGLKSGFLTGLWDRALYARIARLGYLVGIPVETLLAVGLLRGDFSPAAVLGCGFALQTLANPLLILAHAALIVWWSKGERGKLLVTRIAAAGRAAFSNYLGTSILMTAIFYGYGLGLYGAIGRAELYLVVLGAWALMLLWSKPWLDRFRYGPLEWLWRSLARRELQPMRR